MAALGGGVSRRSGPPATTSSWRASSAEPPALLRGEDAPWAARVVLDGLAVDIRLDAWLAFDTIRRMGFGSVIAGRRRALIVERGLSFVALEADGSPLRQAYLAGIYEPDRPLHASPRAVSTCVLSCDHVRRLRGPLLAPGPALPGRSSSGMLASAPGTAQPDPPRRSSPQALQRKYDTVRDFSADFVHTYRGGVLRRQLSERGRVSIKKPGRMRWEYTAPDEKLFVSDGLKIYSYVPQDKQVIVMLRAGRELGDHAGAVSGRQAAAWLATSPPCWRRSPRACPRELDGAQARRPKTPQPDFEWLIVGVDPTTFALRGLVFVDAQGGTSTFSFTNLKENIGLTDKTFDFKIPRGVMWSPMPRRR